MTGQRCVKFFFSISLIIENTDNFDSAFFCVLKCKASIFRVYTSSNFNKAEFVLHNIEVLEREY